MFRQECSESVTDKLLHLDVLKKNYRKQKLNMQRNLRDDCSGVNGAARRMSNLCFLSVHRPPPSAISGVLISVQINK